MKSIIADCKEGVRVTVELNPDRNLINKGTNSGEKGKSGEKTGTNSYSCLEFGAGQNDGKGKRYAGKVVGGQFR